MVPSQGYFTASMGWCRPGRGGRQKVKPPSGMFAKRVEGEVNVGLFQCDVCIGSSNECKRRLPWQARADQG